MKKTLLLLVALCLFIATLFSCGDNVQGSGTGGDTDEGAILAPDVTVDVVKSENESSVPFLELVTGLREVLAEKTGKFPKLLDDTAEESEREIVVGDTLREISSLATERMQVMMKREARKSSDEEAALADLVAFTIYSDGTSVAIVYSSDYVFERAIECFTDIYLAGSSLTLEAGYSKTYTFSYSALLDEEDKAITEAAWVALSEELSDEPNGEEIVAAMRNFYTLYTDDMYIWMANLYEPRQCVCVGECQNTEFCSGGGFYHSNSARDNIGFAPDLYSTWGALSFTRSTGMIDTTYADAIPEWLKKDVGDFIYHQQDEDGAPLPDAPDTPDPEPDEPEVPDAPEEEGKGITFEDALLGSFNPSDVDSQLSAYDGSTVNVVTKGNGQAITVNGSGLTLRPKNALFEGEKANATVFEVTLNYSTLQGSGLDSFWLRQDGSSTPMFRVVTREYDGGNIGIRLIYGTTQTKYDTSSAIGKGSDYRISVVYMWETGITTVSVNGTLIFTYTSPSITKGGYMERVIFLNNADNGKTLDNIVLTNVYISE